MTYDEVQCFKTLCRLLRVLDGFSKEAWNNIKDNPTKEYELTIENVKYLNNKKFPLQSERLKEKAHSRRDSPYIFLNTPWFYLPPLQGNDQHFIPILYLDYDVRETPYNISYRISLFSIYEPNMIWAPKGFGFRFEIGDDRSSHGYCHAQITLDTMNTGKPLPCFPPWIPEQIPCFPMPAKCPVSLFLSLIVTLYGKHLATEIISEVDVAKVFLEPLKNTIRL